MLDERVSWEAPRKLIYNLSYIREKVFVRSMGVQ